MRRRTSDTNGMSIPAINQCLTENCETILACYKRGTDVPDAVVSRFGDCVIRALYSGFPFRFWREEHPKLADIVDTETISAQSVLAMTDIGYGLMTLYLPVFWFIRPETEWTDAVRISEYSDRLERHLSGLFEGIDPLFTPYPVNVRSVLDLSIKDAQEAASGFLLQRHTSGSWDATKQLYAQAMEDDRYSIPPDETGCIPTVYEVKLYGTIEDISRVAQKFDLVDRTIPDEILSGLLEHPDVEYYHVDEWVLPNMLIGGLHLSSAAISAAWIKYTRYPGGHYSMDAGNDLMSLRLFQDDSDSGVILSSPYSSSMPYQLQSRLFFQWFLAHLDRMEATLGNYST